MGQQILEQGAPRLIQIVLLSGESRALTGHRHAECRVPQVILDTLQNGHN